MGNWAGIVGKAFAAEAFAAYVKTLVFTAWRPEFIVLHNTGTPTLAERPFGLTEQHIRNLEAYYIGLGWHAGPHLFVDDRQIWVFSPLTAPGVHSPSWNAISWGVEMLGDYSREPFDRGRGLLVQHNAVAALATLDAAIGLDSSTLRLHHEDPKTTHRDCPGINVMKAAVIQKVHEAKEELRDITPHSLRG